MSMNLQNNALTGFYVCCFYFSLQKCSKVADMYLGLSGERAKKLSNVRFSDAIHLHIGTQMMLEIHFKRNEGEILCCSICRSFSSGLISCGIFQQG